MKLSDRVVKAATPPDNGYTLLWDGALKGFALRVTSRGVKSFVLNYRTEGRERRLTIGRYPAWSIAAARDEAQRLLREVGVGKDPLQARHEARAALTVQELAQRFIDEHLPRKAEQTRKQYQSILKNDILPVLGRHKAGRVSFNDVDGLHRKVSKRAPTRANRMLAVVSAMYNHGIKQGVVDTNPAKGVSRNTENGRTRYLSAAEMRRLWKVLGESQSSRAIKLLALTGARRMEALSATWPQFDLEQGVWTKPASYTKQRREHRVPLSSEATALLKRMRAEATSMYVFPSPDGSTHQRDVKRAWAIARDKAELKGVRLNDLRHTFASVVASGGGSLPQIGALLGHTQAQTTVRYVHLFDEPLREAAEQVAKITKAANDG